jgi:2-phospho-L-lactate guanylyltransferase
VHEPAEPPVTVAVIPVRTFEGAKSRLGAVLDAEERRDLVERLLRRAVRAALGTPGIALVIVVSPDPEVLAVAAAEGATTLLQQSRGLNPALGEARETAARRGAGRLLVIPGDLPAITAADLEEVLAAGDRAGSPSVIVAPDRHDRGTNALLLTPIDVIEPAFGVNSRSTHAWLAESADAVHVEVDGALRLDLDTPDDLLLVEALRPEALGVD